MADDEGLIPDKIEAKAKSAWKKYLAMAAFVATLSSGSATVTMYFFAAWVEMNSRPSDIVNAADLTPELHKLISDNQDEIDWLLEFVCAKHPEDCE